MATTSEYLNQLKTDKQNLGTKMSARGVTVSDDDTFTTLVAKFDEIQSGGDISKFLNTQITSHQSVFTKPVGCWIYLLKKMPRIVISEEVNNCSSMFQYFQGTSIDLHGSNTSNVTSIYGMYQGTNNLQSIDMSDCDLSQVVDSRYIFNGCSDLEELKFGINFGKGFSNYTSNYKNYKIDLYYSTKLNHDSIVNLLNKLYDLNLTYAAIGQSLSTQSLELGSTNKAKLTAQEIAIATSKGWTVS